MTWDFDSGTLRQKPVNPSQEEGVEEGEEGVQLEGITNGEGPTPLSIDDTAMVLGNRGSVIEQDRLLISNRGSVIEVDPADRGARDTVEVGGCERIAMAG